ncbi:hypothetical protein WME95_29315 [Sorangium sp. So ce327]|jgi:hypothetical protein|uniref:hypothetical protein n=1 Tax=Sorangium sp. So ce327 TaxID=3133301 RepID=UPI003F645297
MTDELQRLWQSAPPDKEKIDMEALKTRGSKLRRTVRARNALESAAAIAALYALGAQAYAALAAGDHLSALGAALLMAGLLVVIGVLWKRGSNLRPPALDAPTSEQLAFLRRALARQRDLLRAVPRWYLGPLVPGLVVLLVTAALRFPLGEGIPHATLARAALLAGHLALVALVFGGIAWLNARAARKLDAELAALDGA